MLVNNRNERFILLGKRPRAVRILAELDGAGGVRTVATKPGFFNGEIPVRTVRARHSLTTPETFHQ